MIVFNRKKHLYNLAEFYLREMIDKKEIIKLIYQSDWWNPRYDAYEIINTSLLGLKTFAKDKMKREMDTQKSFTLNKEIAIKYIEYYNLNDIKDVDIFVGIFQYPKLNDSSSYMVVDRIRHSTKLLNTYVKDLLSENHDATFIIKMMNHWDLELGSQQTNESLYNDLLKKGAD